MSATTTCQVCFRRPKEPRTGGAGRRRVSELRVAGWRIWDGLSRTGAPHHVVLCPRCAAGRGPAVVSRSGGAPAVDGYSAGCETCDEVMHPPGLLSAAESWAKKHRCKPQTYVRASTQDPASAPMTVGAGVRRPQGAA